MAACCVKPYSYLPVSHERCKESTAVMVEELECTDDSSVVSSERCKKGKGQEVKAG